MSNFRGIPIGRNQLRTFFLAIVTAAGPAQGQVNSWTNGSGPWQQSAWSLGVLPGTNQSVMITNAGWKAVEIGAATAAGYPQTLNVDSITVASPTNSFNTLLLNYAGTATPLRTGN